MLDYRAQLEDMYCEIWWLFTTICCQVSRFFKKVIQYCEICHKKECSKPLGIQSAYLRELLEDMIPTLGQSIVLSLL